MPTRKRKNVAGPFLIIARACGLALDAEGALDPGTIPHLRPPHGQPHQLWFLRSSGHEGEAIIQSSASGLALDSRRPEKHWVQLREKDEEAWQRWRVLDAADGVGCLLQSTNTGKFLTASSESVSGWCPWSRSERSFAQQWMIAAPHSNLRIRAYGFPRTGARTRDRRHGWQCRWMGRACWRSTDAVAVDPMEPAFETRVVCARRADAFDVRSRYVINLDLGLGAQSRRYARPPGRQGDRPAPTPNRVFCADVMPGMTSGSADEQ